MLKKIVIILSIILTAMLFFAGALYFSYKGGVLSKIVLDSVEIQGQNKGEVTNLFQKFLGFTKKQTYLLLFLNNTELRPGGGFIGAYAVLEIENGIPKVIKVEGTENLDNASDNKLKLKPPLPISKHLKTKYWNFRDSNWSPDFGVSAVKALELYKIENGVKADEINAVIGITPTVIEEIIKISGPITVGGEVFNAENFTEKLEYEVEYNYESKGLAFEDRKQMLKDMTRAFAKRLGESAILNWSEYFKLVNRMFDEKQIAVYSLDAELEEMILAKKWGGRVSSDNREDYLLWVDANLGSLKTDFSIKRFLSYTFKQDKNKEYLGEVKMKYVHTGRFDWRTTRYLDYARVYLPLGTKLIEAEEIFGKNRKIIKEVDQGVELGRQWFGYFISIEPKDTKELVFKFKLSPQVKEKINSRNYNLFVQKQIGSIDTSLSLNLKFDKEVVSAFPGEEEKNWGDENYLLKTDLGKDKSFVVKLKD